MTKFSLEAKVGFFVIIAIALLGFMAVKLNKFSFLKDDGYPLYVYFDSASGLAKDVQVEIAGVQVGRVGAIALENGQAKVTLHIDSNVKLTKDVSALIRTRGILGDKFIELTPGSYAAPVLAAGGRITHTTPSTDIDTLMNVLGEVARDIKQLTGAFSKVLGGESGEASLKTIVDNATSLVETLNRAVAANQQDLSRMVSNLADFSETLKKVGDANQGDIGPTISALRSTAEHMQYLAKNLNQVVTKINSGQGSIGKLVNNSEVLDNLNGAIASLRAIGDKLNKGQGSLGKLLNEPETADSLDQTMGSLQAITAKINRGEGTLGKLVNEDATVENLNTAIDGINKFLSKQDTLQTELDFRSEYLFNSSQAKTYLSLKIKPREDKYYLLQLVDDPRGKDEITDISRTITGTTTSTTTEHRVENKKSEFKFSAQIAKRYYDLVLRGGLFESTGGVAADYYFFNDRLMLSMEAFDFDPDENVHLKFKMDFVPFKHIYVTGGVDDIISNSGRQSMFFGAGLTFQDEDIKTLLSNLPIPTD
jgi:phospholipid/cholesterol/gamma-HCH transport system substrate-binding protein